MAEVPVLVLACIEAAEELPAENQAQLWGSLLPAAWSYQLAPGARTRHGVDDPAPALRAGGRRAARDPAARPAGSAAPDGVLRGGEFRPAPREPLDHVLHLDRWSPPGGRRDGTPPPAGLLARRGRDSRSCSDVRKLSRQSWRRRILSRRDPMSPDAGCFNHGVLYELNAACWARALSRAHSIASRWAASSSIEWPSTSSRIPLTIVSWSSGVSSGLPRSDQRVLATSGIRWFMKYRIPPRPPPRCHTIFCPMMPHRSPGPQDTASSESATSSTPWSMRWTTSR